MSIKTPNILMMRGAQIPGDMSPWWLNSVLWHLILVGPWGGTSFLSHFLHLECWSCSWMSGKFMHPCSWYNVHGVPIIYGLEAGEYKQPNNCAW